MMESFSSSLASVAKQSLLLAMKLGSEHEDETQLRKAPVSIGDADSTRMHQPDSCAADDGHSLPPGDDLHQVPDISTVETSVKHTIIDEPKVASNTHLEINTHSIDGHDSAAPEELLVASELPALWRRSPRPPVTSAEETTPTPSSPTDTETQPAGAAALNGTQAEDEAELVREPSLTSYTHSDGPTQTCSTFDLPSLDFSTEEDEDGPQIDALGSDSSQSAHTAPQASSNTHDLASAVPNPVVEPQPVPSSPPRQALKQRNKLRKAPPPGYTPKAQNSEGGGPDLPGRGIGAAFATFGRGKHSRKVVQMSVTLGATLQKWAMGIGHRARGRMALGGAENHHGAGGGQQHRTRHEEIPIATRQVGGPGGTTVALAVVQAPDTLAGSS